MRPLTVAWQRLVASSGETCDRCALTFEALQRAVAKLKVALEPLDIELKFETSEIAQQTFKDDPLASNRIWVGAKSLEEWLGARVGSSRCWSVCGESECRTLEIEESVFEAVPQNLIVKAVLLAAAQLIGPTPQGAADENTRCTCAPTCCVDALLSS